MTMSCSLVNIVSAENQSSSIVLSSLFFLIILTLLITRSALPPKFLQKPSPYIFMVHLLHRLYGVDAPVRRSPSLATFNDFDYLLLCPMFLLTLSLLNLVRALLTL